MRKGNWKAKVLVGLAAVLGLAVGLAVKAAVPEAYEAFSGILALGSGGLSTIAGVYIGAKLMGLGGD